MNKYLKYQPAWLQLIIFASFAVVLFLIALFIFSPVIIKLYDLKLSDISPFDLNNPNVISALKALQTISSIMFFLVPSLLFGYFSDPKPLHYIGLRKPAPLIFLFIGIVVLIPAIPIVAWSGELNQHLHFSKRWSAIEELIRKTETETDKLLRHMMEMKSGKDLVTMILILGVIPAFVEEFFFRGVLQRLFIQILKRPWAGIIVTAIIFSAMHGQFLGFLPRAILGIILGALFWYSGSLWPGILAHFIYNSLQVVLVYINPGFIEKDPNFTGLMITGSAVLLCSLIWWMSRITETSFAEVYDTDDDLPIGPRDQFIA